MDGEVRLGQDHRTGCAALRELIKGVGDHGDARVLAGGKTQNLQGANLLQQGIIAGALLKIGEALCAVHCALAHQTGMAHAFLRHNPFRRHNATVLGFFKQRKSTEIGVREV